MNSKDVHKLDRLMRVVPKESKDVTVLFDDSFIDFYLTDGAMAIQARFQGEQENTGLTRVNRDALQHGLAATTGEEVEIVLIEDDLVKDIVIKSEHYDMKLDQTGVFDSAQRLFRPGLFDTNTEAKSKHPPRQLVKELRGMAVHKDTVIVHNWDLELPFRPYVDENDLQFDRTSAPMFRAMLVGATRVGREVKFHLGESMIIADVLADTWRARIALAILT